ncbi:hypothetical protein Rhow_009020 [Rhodococcus wratislaviensis]|uniref:Uncharacterized protein n=1 Tax=Rhodococcus wratislaviensis TaxID=44752 RepID=A0A402CM68_RHOWR|nr:hypothetical protein Rhow_009020 [Rhodococcus wratislaviensis]
MVDSGIPHHEYRLLALWVGSTTPPPASFGVLRHPHLRQPALVEPALGRKVGPCSAL